MSNTTPENKTKNLQLKLFAWSSEKCQDASAVFAPANSHLTSLLYLVCLENRIRSMIERREQPLYLSIRWLEGQLKRSDLFNGRLKSRNADEALGRLILTNTKLHERLKEIGAFPDGIKLTKDCARAKQIVLKSSLEDWIAALIGRDSD